MQEKRPHIPYRNSLLTQMLRDSLGGNCRTVMIANVAPETQHVEESISTCRFAQRVAMISNQVRPPARLPACLLSGSPCRQPSMLLVVHWWDCVLGVHSVAGVGGGKWKAAGSAGCHRHALLSTAAQPFLHAQRSHPLETLQTY